MNPRNITRNYEIASLWRPAKRDELVANVVKTGFADADSDGGFVMISDHGKERMMQFDIHTGIASQAADNCTPIFPTNLRSAESPDGKHLLEVRDYDLWLVDLKTDTEIRLTEDGSAEYPYGQGRQTKPYNSFISQPVIHWSPNGRYAVTQRIDLRGVTELTVTEAAPRDGGLPKAHTYLDAFPGDDNVPKVDVLIVDTHYSTIKHADLEPITATHTSPLMRKDLWWSEHSNAIYLVHSTRDWLTLSLYSINPETGESRQLVSEQSDKRIRPNLEFHNPPCVVVNDTSGTATALLWFSERDGWGHLYLYDAQTGEIIRQVTHGEFAVASIHRVDWVNRVCWASIVGLVKADPYRQTICRINLVSGEVEPLSDDDLDHRLLMMPSNADSHPWFIDAASSVADPTHYTVKNWNGEVLVDLGAIDVEKLKSTGWQSPERFSAKAADGKTEVYGTIFYPPHFDASKRYPVIDHVYPGPQMFRSVPYFEGDEVEPYTALGMIGITVDGRGTPSRSREFYDASYRNLAAGSGLEDHVSAIKEIAATRSWIDANNVSIHGRSAGGYGTALAMEFFPDFYKVGIAAAGRYEGRMAMAMILEAYDDPYDPESWARASAIEYADQITGKFLIVHGELDVDCSIHVAYRLIDRLIEANRDFDLLIVPGDDHVFSNRGNYVERRIWDYLTIHSLSEKPPGNFAISD